MHQPIILKNQYSGRNLGVFTSGGDSQGMNAAVRAVVRMGIYIGCRVYFIHEGYQGMVDGGNNIRVATWSSVSGIAGTGGTIIGSARCVDFKERPGRLKAAKNLIKNGIDNLVCIGGDGTLTGANLFKQEWLSLLNELNEKNEITEEEREKFKFLNIVGIVGSIDNDFCGSDMTIGADSAIHRIVEAIDAIVTTASSHQRCFVMEVMGRNCGYLGLVAALACDADWAMIPENPPQEGWENKLCQRLILQRERGNRLNIIIVTEGAIDREGKQITSSYIKEIVSNRLKFDTKITVLGHVQRGGSASAYDRCLATRMGCESVLALMNAKPEDEPLVIGINGNQICHLPLIRSINKCNLLAKLFKDKKFNKVCELRGTKFQHHLNAYLKLSKLKPKCVKEDEKCPYNFAVINVGTPACGVNAAIHSFCREGISRGCKIYAIYEGFQGLVDGNIRELEWTSVYGWNNIGGSQIGCQQVEAQDVGLDKIAAKFKQYKIDGLLLIGGFEAFKSAVQMKNSRDKHNEFLIPLVCLPSTISNNVPGTDFSVGCDTALNEIISMCDKLKQLAVKRVFIIETMGEYCGYLATMAGLASGADQAYIHEEVFTIKDLTDDVNKLRIKLNDGVNCGILLRNENANENFSTDFIFRLLKEEGKGVFSAHESYLGHLQQGGITSPFDRSLSLALALKSLEFMLVKVEKMKNGGTAMIYNHEETAVVIGIKRKSIVFTTLLKLQNETDFNFRIPHDQWWLTLRPLLRILAQRESFYTSEIINDEAMRNS